MKKSFSIFKTLMTLLALALPLSCDTGGGGGGGSSGGVIPVAPAPLA